ncbi:MAG: DUF6448 family protein [Desulforhopalus sp.]
MNNKHKTIKEILIVAVISVFVITSASNVLAHCDTLDGPVVADARNALITGDVTPVLKWVSSSEEEEIKAAFGHTLKVRGLGEEAQGLADTYFFETLVRIHRAGEGAPYSGLKSGTTVDPAVALADQAIENGSAEKLTMVLGNALNDGLSSRFDTVISSKKRADESIKKGREYVEAYVHFTHFAEGIHGIIKGGAPHGEHK